MQEIKNANFQLEIEELESCEALDGEFAAGFGVGLVVVGGLVYGGITT